MRLRAGEWKHTVTMRSGDLYVGEVLDKEVSIKVHGSPIRVPMAKVVWILFANQYGVPRDQVQLVTGTALSGSVKNKTFQVRLQDDGLVMRLPTKDILTIQGMEIGG